MLSKLILITIVSLIMVSIYVLRNKNKDNVTSNKISDKNNAPLTINNDHHLNYEESIKYLQELGLEDSAPQIPPLPKRKPEYDDEEPLGLCFFRTEINNANLNNLTIPRTYMGKSGFYNVTFVNTDLAESNICWNDLIDVDFSSANLSSSDLRASIFKKVLFNNANLEGTDLRHSTFEECDFSGAKMKDVKIANSSGSKLKLTEAQKQEINWQESDGEEPKGG